MGGSGTQSLGPELESVEVENLKETLGKMPRKWRLNFVLYSTYERRQPYDVGLHTLQYEDHSQL